MVSGHTGFSTSLMTGFSLIIALIFLLDATAAAKSLLSQPTISIGHIILLAYSENAPNSPMVIFS